MCLYMYVYICFSSHQNMWCFQISSLINPCPPLHYFMCKRKKMVLVGWILDTNRTHLGMKEFHSPRPPPKKKISKNWHLWPGCIPPDYYQSSAKQPIALGERREKCKNRESHTKRHSQETRWLRSQTTFMVPALKACMQQTCLFYRGRELQAQRWTANTHLERMLFKLTAVYFFFNVLCLRRDLALSIIIMI